MITTGLCPITNQSMIYLVTVCQELKEGAMGIISLKDGRGYHSLKGLSENLEIPLISLNPPSFPPEYPSRYLQ